jgi:dihydrolipoamide dehydrogenase
MVGLSYAELDQNKIVIGEIDFSNQGRARMAEVNHGLLRVYAEKSSGQLLGAEMCAPQAEHLAHLLALAVQQKMTVRELLGMPFYHPVLEEGLSTALRDAASKLGGTDVPDLASCDGLHDTSLE